MLFFLYFLLIIMPLYAYIDPGTGSMLLQVLIAGIMGGLFFIKKKWKKIRSFFKKENSHEK